MVENGDNYLTRREADLLTENKEKDAALHEQKHKEEETARTLALGVEARERSYHDDTHTKEHAAHESKHSAEREAVRVALDAVARERVIHAEAHEREHASHSREHGLNQLAITKAEESNERRFADFFATYNRRHDELRGRVETLEKSDVKGEGKSLGQAAVIAIIIGSVGFFSTVLGIIVVGINLITAAT